MWQGSLSIWPGRFWLRGESQNSLGCKPLHPTFSHNHSLQIRLRSTSFSATRGVIFRHWCTSFTASPSVSEIMTGLWSKKHRTRLRRLKYPCTERAHSLSGAIAISATIHWILTMVWIHLIYKNSLTSPRGAEIHHQWWNNTVGSWRIPLDYKKGHDRLEHS